MGKQREFLPDADLLKACDFVRANVDTFKAAPHVPAAVMIIDAACGTHLTISHGRRVLALCGVKVRAQVARGPSRAARTADAGAGRDVDARLAAMAAQIARNESRIIALEAIIDRIDNRVVEPLR